MFTSGFVNFILKRLQKQQLSLQTIYLFFIVFAHGDGL